MQVKKKITNLISARVLILYLGMASGNFSVTPFCMWIKSTELFPWNHILLLNKVKISIQSCADSRPLVISVLGLLVQFLHLKRVLDIFLNWYDDTFLIECGMLRKWPKLLLFLCDPEMRERLLFLLMRNSPPFLFLSFWIMIVPDVFCRNDLNTDWSTVSYKPDTVYLS